MGPVTRRVARILSLLTGAAAMFYGSLYFPEGWMGFYRRRTVLTRGKTGNLIYRSCSLIGVKDFTISL